MEKKAKIEKLSKKQIEQVKGGLLSQYATLKAAGTKNGGW